MYKITFENVINQGKYDLTSLVGTIDRYHIEGKLTDEEHDELVTRARFGAAPQVDAVDEVVRLWVAVKELTRRIDVLTATPDPDNGETAVEEWPEYVQPTGAHDAYNTGDRITYNGQRYTCNMNGCVWAPDAHPTAWIEEVAEE